MRALRARNNRSEAYDPAEAIGDASPTTPEPPKDAKCGVFGQILLAVVAVAVTVVTGNPALGNLASQAVGIATGIQDKFSFKSLALSYIGGQVNAGVKAVAGSAKTAIGAGIRAVASSAITQGIGVRIGVPTGLQDKFSWAGVAAAGVGAGIGFDFNARFGGDIANRFGERAADTAQYTANSLANAATRSAIDGSNFGDNIVAAIPDVIGQAIGSAVDGRISRALSNPANPVQEVKRAVANDSTGTSSSGRFWDAISKASNAIFGVIGNAYTDFLDIRLPQISDTNAIKYANNDARIRVNAAVVNDDIIVNS